VSNEDVFGQHRRRHTAIHRDQWQRPWDVTIDTTPKAMTFCVPPIPKFRVPYPALMPPPKYLRATREELGRITVDVDAWLDDLDDAHQTFDVVLMKLAEEMEPNRVAQALERPTAGMLKFAGTRPMPRDFLLAMKAGDPWVLGLSPQKRRWLTPELEAALAQVGRPSTRLIDDLSRFQADETDEEDGNDGTTAVIPDPALERFMDLEEEVDPDATGGHRVPVPVATPKKRGRPSGARRREPQEV
jgi:hypothetical protein